MWIILVYILTVQDVHLKWVRSLSAEHFPLLGRSMARGGRPEMIISDNAVQFKLVKNAIDQ